MINDEDRDLLIRVEERFRYFDCIAIKNQRCYNFIKRIAIVCNILTTATIALAFAVSEQYRTSMGIIALVLSTLVLATYQLEEFENFGNKHEKYRRIADLLKSEYELYLENAGVYQVCDSVIKRKYFVNKIESIILGTDMSYLTLITEPRKRKKKG